MNNLNILDVKFRGAKKFIFRVIIIVFIITQSAVTGAQQSEVKWQANWITVPGINRTEYGIYLFRKTFNLESVPGSFPVYVSADNRYKLYVNEKMISTGPSRSDIDHWNYEIVNLAPYLRPGQNIISAKVWNEGIYRPELQISLQTGFFLQGAVKESEILNTGETWKCVRDSSYQPVQVSGYFGEVRVAGYYVAGPGEKIDMHFHIKNFEKLSFDDSSWKHAENVFRKRAGYSFSPVTVKSWTLQRSILPALELTYQRLDKLRKAEGISVKSSFPGEKADVKIPANSKVTLLLDQSFLTNAFPTLIFSGGENSIITLTYAESLYKGTSKGNRNEIEGKTMIGRKDFIISDGTVNQNFTSLVYRTYRYIEITIETKEAPLIINDFYGTFTGYPFVNNAFVKSGNPELERFMEIGWRSARLCAYDTYFDCPYYEQLQYIGDTRIQALVSLYNSGDDRLVKNALNLMDYSRQCDGVTLSRYPTASENQIIPPFSLIYIGMLHDYMMYGPDSEFVADKLSGARLVMNYFIGLQDKDGSLKNVPNWNFTDWATGPNKGWNRGTPPMGKDGSSSIMDFQLLMAFQAAADLENNLGRKEFSELYSKLAEELSTTILTKYWDSSRKLFADTPEKDMYSQHANTLAILTGLVKGDEAQALGRLIITDTTLTESSIYFKYYLHQALVKAGLGNDYLNWLDIWRKNISLGLTTWGEDSQVESTRSDCHAWGSSPNIEFFRTILGVDSDAPGFRKVKIEPNLGTITNISGEMPHPKGKISVSYTLKNKTWEVEIILPDNVSGTFIWEKKAIILNSGVNHFKL
ncbi:MAG: alpha-rhamnosidase [Bacteroidales bacterium]|nr:alpha-rhamnosidase [Bacteroidales bacterium]